MNKIDQRRKIIKWISNILLGLIIALAIYIVIEIIIGFICKKPPCIFNHYIFVVVTNSMEDTIKVGEVVFVKRTSFSSVKLNDIISFLDLNPKDAVYGQYITHRVVGINEEGLLITQGDHNPVSDVMPVGASNFLGIVDHISPLLGKIVTTMTTNYTFVFIFVIVILFIIIAIEVKNFLIIKEQSKADEEKERIKEEILSKIEEQKKGE